MRGLQFLQGLRLPPPNYNYNRRNETPGQLMAMNDRLDIVLLTSNNRLWHVNLKDLRNIDSGTEEGEKWSLCSRLWCLWCSDSLPPNTIIASTTSRVRATGLGLRLGLVITVGLFT